MSNDVLLETRGPIGLITLDRPRALNALSAALQELRGEPPAAPPAPAAR